MWSVLCVFEALGFFERMIEDVTIVGWLAVVTAGRSASSSIVPTKRPPYLPPQSVRCLAHPRLASQLPDASVAPWRFTRSRFPTLFRAERADTHHRSRNFLHGACRWSGRLAWPGRAALLIYLVDQRFGRGRDRPTDGWRQHRGLGAFSGYCWRPGGQPCRWGYLVGGVRTGSSQSGRRSYQTRRGAAWRFILHQSNVRPDCMLVSTSASFDFFWTSVDNTKESVSLVIRTRSTTTCRCPGTEPY